MYELCLHYAKTLPPTQLDSPRPASTAASIKAPAFTAVYVRVVGIYIYVYIYHGWLVGCCIGYHLPS